MPRPRGRRNYNRVADDEDGKLEENKNTNDSGVSKDKNDDETVSLDPKTEATDHNDENHITIVILDPAQAKFKLSVNPEWTIGKVKEIGHPVHKVAASAQRLIYRGRMLSDDTTLVDAGICKDKTILHLFPKPKVVVQGDETAAENSSSTGNDEDAGAHVPRIVLDPDEAEMRSSILVLGSSEVMEAQNNVKLLAFLLLIVCSMELLALFSIMLNPDNDDSSGSPPTDDQPSPSSPTDDIMPGTEPEMRHWRNSDYFDLILSTFGFYVATLGIKATTENTRTLARRYMICTGIVAVFWNCFYFYLNVMMEKELEAKRLAKLDDDEYAPPPESDSDTYMKAFFGILIPMLVWVLCCVRAWQFHHLIAQAEEEAEGRIRSELDLEEGEEQQQEIVPVSGATLT